MLYIFYDLSFVVKLCKIGLRVYLLLSSAIERVLILLDRLFVKSVIYVPTKFSSVTYFHQKYNHIIKY